MTARFVALLRGINVGGKNPVKMAALKAAFEDHGLQNVSTYIQSGNVLFDAPRTPATKLVTELEHMLSKRFHADLRVAVRSRQQLGRVVTGKPRGFGSAPKDYRYDVIFVLGRLKPDRVVAQLDPKEGVDRVWSGDGVVYFSRVAARAAQSRLSRIVSLPVYQELTIRNWNTTTRLLALLER